MIVRKANIADVLAITNLYKKAAEVPDGIARNSDEINQNLIAEFFKKSSQKGKRGLMLVIENPQNPAELIAQIHCYKFWQILGLRRVKFSLR